MPLSSVRLTTATAFLSTYLSTLSKKLQNVQNYAARVVKKLKSRTSTTRHLRDLHWLPVHYRIQFKVALLTYKSLNNVAPIYLQNLLEVHRPRNLRSSSMVYLKRKKHSKWYGSRAFSVAAPSPCISKTSPPSLPAKPT